MTSFFISFFVTLEIFAVIISVFLIIRKYNQSISEAYSYSTILVFALYSLSVQTFFLLKIHEYYYIFDMAIIIFSFYQIRKNRQLLFATFHETVLFYKKYKLLLSLMAIVFTYLFLQVLFSPPHSHDSFVYHLARVLMMQNEGSYFLTNFTTYHQTVFPLGYDILSFLFLRFFSDYGLSIFGFLSYTVIVSGSFSLVKNIFNDTRLALKTSFIIASLSELILQATSTGNDIPAAATAVVCFLAGYNLLKKGNILHIYVIAIAVLWGLSVKSYFAGFALPFLVLLFFLCIRESVLKTILNTIFKKEYINYYLVLPLGLFLCLAIFFGNNFKIYGNVFGPESFLKFHQNQNGLAGGIFNVGRYVVQIIGLPQEYGGEKLNKIHDKILGKHKFYGVVGFDQIDLSAKPFYAEGYSWFGPLGILLVIPSIFYAFFAGKGYIRLICFSLLIFLGIISYEIGWMPYNNRFFSIFFAGTAVCIAFLMKKTASVKYLERIILIIALYTMISAMLLNYDKPLINSGKMATTVKQFTSLDLDLSLVAPLSPDPFSSWLNFVRDRDMIYRKAYGGPVVREFTTLIEKGSNVLMVGEGFWLFPFLVNRPDLNFTVSKPEDITVAGKAYNIYKKSDYLYLKEKFNYIMFFEDFYKNKKMHAIDYLETEKEKKVFSYRYSNHEISIYKF